MTWPALERRVKAIRARAAVRSWHFRQRDRADGVWYRLRRVLVDAEEAWVAPIEVGEALIRQGTAPEPVGDALEPPRRILFVPAGLPATLPGTRQVDVRLSADLLDAACLLLVPFPTRAAAHGV